MKKTIVILLSVLFVTLGYAKTSKTHTQFNCDIRVNFEDKKIQNGSVFYLRKNLFDGHLGSILDSCVLKNNKLLFNTRLKETFMGYISLKNIDSIASPDFIIANKPIKINWIKAIDWIKEDPASIIIDGGERNFIKQYQTSFSQRVNYIDISSQISQFGIVKPENLNYKYWVDYQNQIYKWVSNNPKKYFTLIKLYDNRFSMSEKMIVKCLEALKPIYNSTTIYNDLSKYIKSRKVSLLEGNLINIDLIDNKQNKLKIKDVFLPNKDLYVVDFGASWCGYCILQARELNKNYELIDTTKIQLISISVDKEVNDWLEFEKKENYKWKSYRINREIDKDNIPSIFSLFPTYFVLDKTKKIIGKYYSIDDIPFLKLKH